MEFTSEKSFHACSEFGGKCEKHSWELFSVSDARKLGQPVIDS
jgi:hypothetical protein